MMQSKFVNFNGFVPLDTNYSKYQKFFHLKELKLDVKNKSVKLNSMLNVMFLVVILG